MLKIHIFKRIVIWYKNMLQNTLQKTLFTCKISDGYSFRNTLSMSKNETDEITLLISEKKMVIVFMNKGGYCIHDILINGEELLYFRYNIVDYEEYPITVNTNDILNTTKGVGRKDAIKIKWMEKSDKLIIQPEKSGKDNSRASESYVNIISKTYNKLELRNDFSENENVIKILSKDFSEICSQVSSYKCAHLEITGGAEKMIFKGILPDGTIAIINDHIPYINSAYKNADIVETICNDKDKCQLNVLKYDNTVKIIIPLNTVKTLSKFQNISPSGTLLKFYFVRGKAVKIESKIGTYGSYNMFLRDPKK